MQESPIIRVHFEQLGEDRYTTIQLTETITAEEVCRSAVAKLVGSVKIDIECGFEGFRAVFEGEKCGNAGEREEICSV
jgi:hypothetical protein